MSGTLTVRDALPSPVVFSPASFLPRAVPLPPLVARLDWRAVLLAPLLPAPEALPMRCQTCGERVRLDSDVRVGRRHGGSWVDSFGEWECAPVVWGDDRTHGPLVPLDDADAADEHAGDLADHLVLDHRLDPRDVAGSADLDGLHRDAHAREDECCAPCTDGDHATVEDGTCTCCGAVL